MSPPGPSSTIRDELLAVLNAITDPILLIEQGGQIVAANSSARSHFASLVPSMMLQDLADESPEHIADFVSLARRSKAPVPGKLTVGGVPPGPARWIRVAANVASPGNVQRPPTLMLRWRDTSVSRVFNELNEKVRALNREVNNWQLVHAERSALLRRLEDTAALCQDQVQLLETVTDNVSTALFMLDERGYPSYLNPAAASLMGYALEEISDRHLHETVHRSPSDRTADPIEDCPLALAFASNSPVGPFEDTFISKIEERVPVIAMAAPIRRGNRPVGVVIEARDNRENKARALQIARLHDELRQTIADLQHANAAKDEFLGMVSHELKNPLTTVVGIARHLEQRYEQVDEPTRQGALRVLAQDAARLAEIVENMFTLSRAERRPPDLEPIILSRVVEKAVNEYRKRRRERDFDVRLEDDRATALGYPGWVEQIMLNLLSNANKYSEAGEPIDVLVRTTDSHVEVQVSDRGPGIAEEERERIMEAFVRGTLGSTSVYGLGLGLSVCQRLVVLMEGEISLQRRSDVSGTTATFRLPLLLE